jgi:hypothetical protein
MNVFRVLSALLLVVGVAAAAAAQQAPPSAAEAEQIRARQKIFMMEGVLERAVNVGIDTFRRQLISVMPDDMLLVTGDAPQARGFRLDGYGVFFDVEVPQVRPSLAWSLRTMNETANVFARDLERMRAQLLQAVPDPQQRVELERQLIRIQQQVAPPRAADARSGVTAQSVSRAPVAPPATVPPPAPPSPAAPPAPAVPPPATGAGPAAAVLRDPGQAYTEAVASALIDAMLENSGSLIIAADEFLTVAARDNAQANRFLASDPSEVMTLVLRVKGSDIADFQARRLSLEDVRKRVEVRAF